MEANSGPTLKIILLGECSVGKTCLLQRFATDKFISSYAATIGTDFVSKEISIKSKSLLLQVWDTAGGEKHAALIPAYIRGAHGIALVYDVNNRTSFERIEKWMKFAKNHILTGSSWLLVGTRSDEAKEDRVSDEEGRQLAMDLGILFLEASAKTGKNVNEVFLALAEAALEKQQLAESLAPSSLDEESLRLPALDNKEQDAGGQGCC